MDLRFGLVAAVIANVNRDPEKTPAPFQPVDFYPDPEADPDEDSAEEHIAALEQWALVYGAQGGEETAAA
jgi:hypothetical protein